MKECKRKPLEEGGQQPDSIRGQVEGTYLKEIADTISWKKKKRKEIREETHIKNHPAQTSSGRDRVCHDDL